MPDSQRAWRVAATSLGGGPTGTVTSRIEAIARSRMSSDISLMEGSVDCWFICTSPARQSHHSQRRNSYWPSFNSSRKRCRARWTVTPTALSVMPIRSPSSRWLQPQSTCRENTSACLSGSCDSASRKRSDNSPATACSAGPASVDVASASARRSDPSPLSCRPPPCRYRFLSRSKARAVARLHNNAGQQSTAWRRENVNAATNVSWKHSSTSSRLASNRQRARQTAGPSFATMVSQFVMKSSDCHFRRRSLRGNRVKGRMRLPPR